MSDLFKTKSLKTLLSEAGEHGEHSLKRELGPVSLVALGIGAIIGAGIFVMSGLGAHYAGPGLMLSFVLSGLGCAFAGLCYAEFAAMIPLAGSASTSTCRYGWPTTTGPVCAWPRIRSPATWRLHRIRAWPSELKHTSQRWMPSNMLNRQSCCSARMICSARLIYLG